MLSKLVAVISKPPLAWISASVFLISARTLSCTSGFRASSYSAQVTEFAVVSWPASRIVLKIELTTKFCECEVSLPHLGDYLVFSQLGPLVFWVVCFHFNGKSAPTQSVRGEMNWPSKLKTSFPPSFSCLSFTSCLATLWTSFLFAKSILMPAPGACSHKNVARPDGI